MIKIDFITNDEYLKDLMEFLSNNMDDGWGKPFDFMSQQDKEEVINDFKNTAAENFKELGYQTIKSKYLVTGYSSAEFELIPEYFSIVLKYKGKKLEVDLNNLK